MMGKHKYQPLNVDLGQLRDQEPVRASVQNIYRWKKDGQKYFVAEATDSGSVFDYGTFFEIPGSGLSRTALRHKVYQMLSAPVAWQQLDAEDLQTHLTESDDKRLSEGDLLQRLRTYGASTHHIGMVDAKTGDVTSNLIDTNLVIIKEFPVIKPVHFPFGGRQAWDYHKYQVAKRKLLAIEHIFRFGSPAGSAIEQRFRSVMQTGDEELVARTLESMGLQEPVVPWGTFSHLLYDCSTKYEDHDRYVDWQEAVHISGIRHEHFSDAIDLLSLCTLLLRKMFSELGFVLWDMKWEAAYDKGEIIVVDTVDHDSVRITSDITFDGRRFFAHFNKQAIRDYYRILHPDWHAALGDAKARAEVDSLARPFRAILDEGVDNGIYPAVPTLDPAFAAIQSDKYMAVSKGDTRTKIEQLELVQELVRRELRYYENRGYRDQYLEQISLPAS